MRESWRRVESKGGNVVGMRFGVGLLELHSSQIPVGYVRNQLDCSRAEIAKFRTKNQSSLRSGTFLFLPPDKIGHCSEKRTDKVPVLCLVSSERSASSQKSSEKDERLTLDLERFFREVPQIPSSYGTIPSCNECYIAVLP